MSYKRVVCLQNSSMLTLKTLEKGHWILVFFFFSNVAGAASADLDGLFFRPPVQLLCNACILEPLITFLASFTYGYHSLFK